jgi:hypothetical protein
MRLFNLTTKQLKVLKGRIPNIKNLKIYTGGVTPLNPCYEFREILDQRGLKVEEPAIYAFQNVGMHTDSMSSKNYGVVIGVLQGGGVFSYFKNLKDYRNKKVSEHTIEKGNVIYFDDKLPHSFTLEGKEKWCVCCLADVKKRQVQSLFKNESPF